MKLTKSLNVTVAFVLATILCLTASVWGQTKEQLAAKGEQIQTDSWPQFDDAKFTLRYPPGWRIREQGETDADGQHFSFNDGTRTFGGMGVSFLKRASVFGSDVKKRDATTYAAMLRRVVQVDPQFVTEFTRGTMRGMRFNAFQSINGRPATWRLDVVEVDGTYIAMVFGFYRPDNASQLSAVETALETFELKASR